jgi:hypothetical protein
MVRVLIGGIIAGVLAFCGGAVGHTVLNLESRTFQPLPDEAAVADTLSKSQTGPGIYDFPAMAKDYQNLSAEEKAKEWERCN